MPHPAKAPNRDRDERLARGLAEDVRRQQRETAELVQALAGVQIPALAGQHSRRTLDEMVADSGFSTADPAELAPILRIDGRVYR